MLVGCLFKRHSDLRMINSDLPTDALVRGIEYLRMVRRLALSPLMIDPLDDIFATKYSHNVQICSWIGENIHAVNTTLMIYLNACHECFLDSDRTQYQIFATPLASQFGIDGLCNIFVHPTTILIDVGRTSPMHWLGVVAHEYAHAYVGDIGHGTRFAQVLTHLCLGLGLELPVWETETMEAWLCNYPHCQPNLDPLAFGMVNHI